MKLKGNSFYKNMIKHLKRNKKTTFTLSTKNMEKDLWALYLLLKIKHGKEKG